MMGDRKGERPARKRTKAGQKDSQTPPDRSESVSKQRDGETRKMTDVVDVVEDKELRTQPTPTPPDPHP